MVPRASHQFLPLGVIGLIIKMSEFFADQENDFLAKMVNFALLMDGTMEIYKNRLKMSADL